MSRSGLKAEGSLGQRYLRLTSNNGHMADIAECHVPLGEAGAACSLCRQDVLAHRSRVAVHLIQALLDHVANRYHADNPLVLDDR